MPAHSHHRWHQHPLDYNSWAEMLVKCNRNSFARPETDPNFGPWARRPLPPVTASADELRSPSPRNSRAQMIESYRQEMMDLVRNMPEEEDQEVAAYELSLRDIVESPEENKPEEETAEDSKEMMRKQSSVSRGENKGAAGLLMKAFFPRSSSALGGRKRNAGCGGGENAKISPKPSNSDFDERSCSNSCDSSCRRNRG